MNPLQRILIEKTNDNGFEHLHKCTKSPIGFAYS